MILEQFEEAMRNSRQIREAAGTSPGEGKRRGPSPGVIRIIRLWVCFQSRHLMTQRVGGLENFILHVLCWLILAVVNRLCVYVFMSFVNVRIYKSEIASSRSRNGFDNLFCNDFETQQISFLLWCRIWASCVRFPWQA